MPQPVIALSALFTDEHRQFETALQSFIAREVNPYVDEWEAEGIFPAKDLFSKMGKAGFLGAIKPVDFGGLGLEYSYGVLMAEVLGEIECGAVSMAIGVQTDMATPALAKFGSDRVRSEFLTPSVTGDAVACLGVSEPGAGSDVANIKTHARKDGGDYVINGSKMWITNGTQADWICLLANTGDGGKPHQSKTLICVPMRTKGISVAPRFNKLGMRSSDTTQVFFDNVRVPQANRIGEEGHGFRYQMIQFQEERLWAAANVLRQLERVIRFTREYCSQRSAFNRQLSEFQVIQFRLAELDTEIEAIRSLVYRAAQDFMAGQDVTRLASMAKLKAGRACRVVTDACLQYWGGQGFMWEAPVARAYRDLRLISIGGGADEVMLQILAKMATA
jgi:citronellyl-CoA dehydrogenase